MIERSASLDEFEERVCALYPQQPLSLTGIKLCRQDKGKQLLLLIGYDSLAELIQLVGKSTVIVQPRIDLPLPPAAVADRLRLACRAHSIGRQVDSHCATKDRPAPPANCCG